MSHRLKISAPSVLRPILSSLDLFSKHEWLFDVNRDIICSFSPDISIAFNSHRQNLLGAIGYYLPLDRSLVANPDLIKRADVVLQKDLSDLRYITMTRDDEKSLSVRTPISNHVHLNPVNLFKVNDVQGALMAVEMGIGYSALPTFLISENQKLRSFQALHSNGTVNQTTLVVSTSDTNTGKIAFRSSIYSITSYLSAATRSHWVNFGYRPNVLQMSKVA